MIGTEEVLEVLGDDRSLADLSRYFGNGLEQAPFTGSRFNSLGANDRDRITASDILAVQCLSVTIPIHVTLDLLEGVLGASVADLLADVPDDVDLGSHAATVHVVPGASADQAWHLLDAETGVGWVTAGKLLARKRPRLLPVYDTIVRCALGKPAPGAVWSAYHRLLQSPDIIERLDGLHRQAGLPPEVPRLRVLDVVLWMRHRRAHRPGACPGLN